MSSVIFNPGQLPVLSVAEQERLANVWFNSKERKALRERQVKLEKSIKVVSVGSYSPMDRDRGEDNR